MSRVSDPTLSRDGQRVLVSRDLLARAQRTLGTGSERETVARALEDVIARSRAAAAIRRLGGRRRLRVPDDLR
jgi:hypothetical protein